MGAVGGVDVMPAGHRPVSCAEIQPHLFRPQLCKCMLQRGHYQRTLQPRQPPQLPCSLVVRFIDHMDQPVAVHPYQPHTADGGPHFPADSELTRRVVVVHDQASSHRCTHLEITYLAASSRAWPATNSRPAANRANPSSQGSASSPPPASHQPG